MIVNCALYESGHRRDGDLPLERAGSAARDEGSFVWLGVFEPSAEEFEAIAGEFDLHELAVEDAIKAHQRPKVEQYGDTLLVVVKTARYVDPEEVIEIGELLLFVNPVERIYKLEREVLDFDTAVAPLSGVVDEISRGHFEVVPDELGEYYRDVHDHLRRVSGRVRGFRELLGSALSSARCSTGASNGPAGSRAA